jgi:hypothetical protein
MSRARTLPHDVAAMATRRAAGQKAAKAQKRMKAARATIADAYDPARWGPGGSEWGANQLPDTDMSIPAILARLRAREGQTTKTEPC